MKFVTLQLIPIVLVLLDRKNKKEIIEWQTCCHFYFVDNFIEPPSFGEKISLSNWTFLFAVVCFEFRMNILYIIIIVIVIVVVIEREKPPTDMVCRHTILVCHLPYKGVYHSILFTSFYWTLANGFTVLELQNSSTNSVVKQYNAYVNFTSSFPFPPQYIPVDGSVDVEKCSIAL